MFCESLLYQGLSDLLFGLLEVFFGDWLAGLVCGVVEPVESVFEVLCGGGEVGECFVVE